MVSPHEIESPTLANANISAKVFNDPVIVVFGIVPCGLEWFAHVSVSLCTGIPSAKVFKEPDVLGRAL